MFAFLKSLFESKLANILADFHKVIADLENHARQELTKAETLKGKILALADKKDAAIASANQATSVAGKLTALTSATP